MPQSATLTVHPLVTQTFAAIANGKTVDQPRPERDAPKYLGLAALSQQVEVQMISDVKAESYKPKMFRPDMTVAQPIIDQFVPADKQVHLFDRILQTAGSERFEKVFLSQKMLQFNLDGVQDHDIKNNLITALQTSPFTIVAIEGATKLLTDVAPQYPTADFMMRLTKLDDVTAKQVTLTEANIRRAYLNKVGQAIAVAAPESRGLIASQMQNTNEVPQPQATALLQAA